MDQTFNADDYVAQEQLLFGLDHVRGLQYADVPNNDLYQQLQYGVQSYDHRSASPDFILYRPQSIPLSSSEMLDISHDWTVSQALSLPCHPFNSQFKDPATSMVDYAAWNSSPVLQNTAYPGSNPVNIPTKPSEAQYHFLSPTSTVDTSFYSHGSWASSHTSTSQVESVGENATPCNTTFEEPIQFSKQPVSGSRGMTSTSPLSMIQYSAAENTHRLTPAMTSGGKRPRGRTGPLNEAQRRSTAYMRNVKACQSCRSRKAKCDPGIPCRQCINYYKQNLIHHPCRGQQLEDIADKFLQGHIFPRKRALGTDFGVNFRTFPDSDFTIYLTLGFGEPFPWPAQVVSSLNCSKFSCELIHEHVHYKWPEHHMNHAERTEKKEWVFPALLTNTSELKSAVDEHLTRLIDSPANFTHFPVYKSPLVVLKHIYEFYLKLSESNENRPAKKLLGQAFKLLNLIHIGGDTRVSPSENTRRILNYFFSIDVREQDVVPCYIRGQLGEVFSKLASEYMKEVLSKLEIECLNKNSSRFPLITCTFLVLLMSIESLQHKTHKDAFHSIQDGGTNSSPNVEDEIDGMVDLLEFYKNCCGTTHRERLLSLVDGGQIWTSRNAPSAFTAGETVILRLREAILQSKSYLQERSKESLETSGGDITVFFDRLVARLLLLEADRPIV
ncbi:uncharacterized protein PV09_05496 [Verruconis gallopava]|uniref:Zn(2)-C6 fungal-type domain-containing protein n=1 Tax=Verruconis gallopava TaxID=253628 RepID=A0A0D1XLH6_9PEZI|nr:uncharacterized protein PV09_05496 [Verruconis gallopava]KIW03281.1 hypothetical protein PV09_05496 [Verruconis gallopava]